MGKYDDYLVDIDEGEDPYSQYLVDTEEDYEAPEEVQEPEEPGFVGSISRGIDEMQGSLYGAAGLVGSAVGSESLRDWGIEGYKRNMAEAEENAATTAFKDIDSIDDAWTWVKETGGSLVPSMVEAAAGALVGSVIAPGPGTAAGAFASKTLLKKGIKEAVKKGMKTKFGKELGKEGLEEAVTKAALTKMGAGAGMFGAVAPVEAGGNYAELLTEHDVDAPFSSAAFGAAAASLELLGGNSRLINSLVPGAGDVIKKALSKGDRHTAVRVLKEVALNSPAEALQEMGQEALSALNIVANTDEEFFTQENYDRLIEAGAAGALGGFAGGVVQGVTGKPGVETEKDPYADYLVDLHDKMDAAETEDRGSRSVGVRDRREVEETIDDEDGEDGGTPTTRTGTKVVSGQTGAKDTPLARRAALLKQIGESKQDKKVREELENIRRTREGSVEERRKDTQAAKASREYVPGTPEWEKQQAEQEGYEYPTPTRRDSGDFENMPTRELRDYVGEENLPLSKNLNRKPIKRSELIRLAKKRFDAEEQAPAIARARRAGAKQPVAKHTPPVLRSAPETKTQVEEKAEVTVEEKTGPLWKKKSEEIKADVGAKKVFKDNPGGSWLEGDIEVAKSGGSGSVTAGVRSILLPVDTLLGLKGRNKEHLRIKDGDQRVQKLVADMEENGFREGKEPFLNVEYDGSVNINEGNHRIRAAKLAGITHIPVDISYFAGGERQDGPMSFEKLAEHNKKKEAAKTPKKETPLDRRNLWRKNNVKELDSKGDISKDYELMENKDMRNVSQMTEDELAQEYKNHPHINADPEELAVLYYKDEIALKSIGGHAVFKSLIREGKTDSQKAWARAYEYAKKNYLQPEEDVNVKDSDKQKTQVQRELQGELQKGEQDKVQEKEEGVKRTPAGKKLVLPLEGDRGDYLVEYDSDLLERANDMVTELDKMETDFWGDQIPGGGPRFADDLNTLRGKLTGSVERLAMDVKANKLGYKGKKGKTKEQIQKVRERVEKILSTDYKNDPKYKQIDPNRFPNADKSGIVEAENPYYNRKYSNPHTVDGHRVVLAWTRNYVGKDFAEKYPETKKSPLAQEIPSYWVAINESGGTDGIGSTPERAVESLKKNLEKEKKYNYELNEKQYSRVELVGLPNPRIRSIAHARGVEKWKTARIETLRNGILEAQAKQKVADEVAENIEPDTPEVQYSVTPDKSGLTLKDVQKLFKGQRVHFDKSGNIVVHTKGGNKLLIKSVEQVDPDTYRFKLGHGHRFNKLTQEVTGKYEDGVVTVVKGAGGKFTLTHESEHWMEDIGLITPDEIAALRAKIKRLHKENKWTTLNKDNVGGAEDRAEYIADRMWKRGDKGVVGKLLQKIVDIVDSFVNLFKVTARSVERQIESGKIFSRPGGGVAVNAPMYQARSLVGKLAAMPGFKTWFGKSILKHKDGTPLVFFYSDKASLGAQPISEILEKPGTTVKEADKEKRKLKRQVIDGIRSGKYDGAVRFGTVDELKRLLKIGKMPVSREHGAIHATPIMGRNDNFVPAYGDYNKHQMAIVFPKSATQKKTKAHTKEVLIDKNVDLNELTFLIDNHSKPYTYKELQQLENIDGSGRKQEGLFKVFAKERAATIAGRGTMPRGVVVKAENPYVVDFKGNPWSESFAEKQIAKAKANGKDSVIFKNVKEGSSTGHQVVVFNSGRIKSLGSRAQYRVQKKAAPRTSADIFGTKKKPIKERVDEIRESASNWRTKIFDRFEPIKMLGMKAYMLHRAIPGVQSVMNALMDHGKLFWNDGSLDTNERGKGFLKWLKDLGPDAEHAFHYIAAKRAELIEAEDRAKGLKPGDKGWRTTISKADRDIIFKEAGKPKTRKSWDEINKEFQGYNKNILDLAVQAGLIDPEMRKVWEKEWWVPFYRVFEDKELHREYVKSPQKGKKYLSAQIHELRGSERAIGDPLENVLRSWTHLIGESMKNIARKEAFEAGQNKTVTVDGKQVPLFEKVTRKDTLTFNKVGNNVSIAFEKDGTPILSFRENGKPVYFKVNNSELFTALENAPQIFNNPVMRLMRWFKRLLTAGVTFGPAFRIANMMRDTLHTAIVAKSFIPIVDSYRGAVKILTRHPDYISFMASGNAFGGSYTRADNPEAMSKYIKHIIKKEGKGATNRILDTPAKILRFWEAIGEASENAARVQLYSKQKAAGKTHLEAGFAGRDIMDFQMSGTSNIVNFITATVPFVNARMQGLYRMGRGYREDPKGFLVKGAMLSMASLALWARFQDDERYKELEDWDRFSYYHFWIGDQHFRIPKPFETGAIFSTMTEAAANVASGNDEVTHFFDAIGQTMFDTFAMNPMPQIAKPIYEAYTNKNMFTGRQIVNKYAQDLSAMGQFDTDPYARPVTYLAAKLGISPKKAEHVLRGYLGTYGMILMGTGDVLAKSIGDFPDLPKTVDRYPFVGRFVRHSPNKYTKYTTQFYDLANEMQGLAQRINSLKRFNKADEIKELQKDKRKQLFWRKTFDRQRRKLAKINRKMKVIASGSGVNKQEKIDELTIKRNEITKRIVTAYLEGK
jgi:hypothetical protein